MSTGARLLRRQADGSWPEEAAAITEVDLRLQGIDLTVPLASIYQTTRLAAD